MDAGIENSIDLIEKLKNDKDFWYGWQSNIAMCIFDNFKVILAGNPMLFTLVNKSANDFLKLLTRDKIE
jgi:hypothetical protein